MYIFDDGDIIVRLYSSSRTAIGIYEANRTHNKFTYLGESFQMDGGLTKFSNYHIENTYEYRLAKYSEVKILLKDLSYYRKYFSDSSINRYRNYESYYNIVKNYMYNKTIEGLRMSKLKHLNLIE